MTIHKQSAHRSAHHNGQRIAAVLGPTNTGKTHFAIERMLAHRSGMIGLPLRLLAREVYDKIVRLKGEQVCALITGEQKIVPPNASYFVCTVEAMPLDLSVAFLAIDEIQLCADPTRGHVFTDRLLHARGEEETLFLGAETMRGIIQRFVPGTDFITRPRFSDLAYTGGKKLTRLPRRSAIVGFSAEDVYGIADLVRRQRGGAAVVLGALSPRTRNAQVELYQSGDVDFLVATDAIGMGLNMDVDHVAFAAREKFDGTTVRPLKPDEIGQIAGRAGRHMNDGTFGVTGDAEPFEDEMALRVETHRYDPVRILQWRNSTLSYHSLSALLQSLDEPPPSRGLAKARPSSDVVSLRTLAENAGIMDIARAPAAVRRLWDACQIPDFRKITSDEHTKLVSQIYRYLMSDDGVLPEDWLGRQIARLDNIEGDVATLSGRLAQIRTWTYAANRPGWLKDSGHWQEQTRAVEDRLSDSLHEKLTQRFIDRRTSILMRGLRDDETFNVTFDDAGTVSIGGETLGKLEGLRFTADPRAEGIHGRTLRAAALKGLDGELSARAIRLCSAGDSEITLSEHGRLWWDGAIVGHLVAGTQPLNPHVNSVVDENMQAELHQRVQQRLNDWVAARIATRLEPLIALRNAVDAKPGNKVSLPATARGLAHQLYEAFGTLDRKNAVMPQDERAAMRSLRPYGVIFARRALYLPKLLRPEAAQLLGLLWAVHEKCDRIPSPPTPGLTSFNRDDTHPDGFLLAAGFHVIGPRAIRADMLDRLEGELEATAKTGTTAQDVLPRLVSLLGCDRSTLEAVLAALDWTQIEVANTGSATTVWRKMPRARNEHHGKIGKAQTARKKRSPQPRPDSPFSALAQLLGNT